MTSNINKKVLSKHDDSDAVSYELQLRASITDESEMNSED